MEIKYKEKEEASVSINIRFWTDGKEKSSRNRNTEFCWAQLKELKKFLDSKNVNIDINLFDFSETKQIKDAIHIPYPKNDYKLAEKTNDIIKHNVDNIFWNPLTLDLLKGLTRENGIQFGGEFLNYTNNYAMKFKNINKKKII